MIPDTRNCNQRGNVTMSTALEREIAARQAGKDADAAFSLACAKLGLRINATLAAPIALIVLAESEQAPDLQGADRMKKPKPPKILDAIADVVLRYKPKAKSKPAKKRQRRAKRVRQNPSR